MDDGTAQMLVAALEDWGLELPPDFNEHTPLFESGLLDSVALFNLVLWVEDRTGRSIDPGAQDLQQSWRDVESIVRFIGSNGNETVVPAPRSPAGPRPADKLSFERYRPEFRTRVAELQTLMWSPDAALNARYFDWLYHANPHRSESPLIYLALDDGDLVGMRGFWNARWQIGGREIPLLMADDLLIRPGYRNQGIHQRLMEAAFADLRHKGFSHALNLSGSPVNVLTSLTMGWARAGLLEMMGTQPDGSNGRARLRSAMRKVPLAWRYADSRLAYSHSERTPFHRFDRQLARGQSQHASITLSRCDRAQAMAALVSRQSTDGRIRQVRSETYLQWRYQNPLREYRFLYSGGDEMNGYLVLSCPSARAVPGGRVMVADFEAESDSVLRELLDEALRWVDEAASWTATLTSEQRLAMQDAKFVPVDAERQARGCPALLVRSLGTDGVLPLHGTSLSEVKNWDLRPLYSMSA